MVVIVILKNNLSHLLLAVFLLLGSLNYTHGQAIASQLNCFQSNAGQWDDDILYQLNTASSAIIFYKNRISFALLKSTFPPSRQSENQPLGLQPILPVNEYLVWDLTFEGANNSVPLGKDSVPSVFRFFGNGEYLAKPIHTYKKIIYKDIYNNIDFVIYINDESNTIEYDFILNPNADESLIKMKYTGIEGLQINDDQSISIKTLWGDFRETKPVSNCQKDKKKLEVIYNLHEKGILGFAVDSERDKSQALTIDPVMLNWSSFLYGKAPWDVNRNDCPYTLITGVDLDAVGNTYAVGYTNTEFPKIAGSYDTGHIWVKSFYSGFYLKINQKGDSLYFFDYLGGKGVYCSTSFISINGKGEAAITGGASKGFPLTPGALDSIWGNGSFITTFNSRGDSLKFSTLFPGTVGRRALIILESGDVLTAGSSFGYIPMKSNSYQNTFQGGNYDAFVARIKSDGKSLVYATYLGGNATEYALDIAVNKKEEVYVVGATQSYNFPIVSNNSALNTFHGVVDGFLTKLDAKLSKVIFSNLIGGVKEEELQSIFLNNNEEIYVAGISNSTDFPVSLYPKAFQNKLAGKTDIVAMKFLPNGSNYRYSTYLGGSSDERYIYDGSHPVQIAATLKDEAIITGMSTSYDFPVTADAMQKTKKSKDSLSSCLTLSKLSPLGDKLIYSTYMGGSGIEILGASKVKRFKCIMNIALAGITRSRDYPTTKGVLYPKPPSDTLFGTNINYSVGFISKFSDTLKVEKPDFGNRIKTRCNDFLEILDGLNQGSYRRWSTGDSSQFLLVNKGGTYWVAATYGCDTIRDSITIINPINKANFTISDTAQCMAGNSFTFKETTQLKKTNRKESRWYFDDSTRIIDTIAKKSFTTPGIHFIKLVSQSTSDCQDSITKTVHVYQNSKPKFVINDSSQCLKNQSFNYTNTTADTGKISYQWDLGDQTYSSQKNITAKTYAKDSSYFIKLISITDNNCKDTATKIIAVKPSPKADFSWDLACSRTVTKFQYTGSKPVQSFHWNFNNESPSYLENPSYLFTLAGTKKISLATTSSNGCTDTIKKDVVIKPQSKADFTATDVCETDSAVFINLSKDATGYNWKFGDGQNSKLQNPKHKFQITSTTTYNVTLVAQVTNGCSDSISKAITINKNPSSDFSYTYNGVKVDLKITKAGNAYQWKFGNTDSAKTSATTYSHTIKSSDQTKVCLTATDISGCNSQTCKNISVGILKVLKSEGFKLYPNPNSGKFTIEIENPSKDVSIEIFDLLGKLVKTVETNSSKSVYEIDLNSVDGMYWVRVKNGDAVWNQKVIVSKSE